ncbi:flagellar hook capping FlgD N-terminal domain-containing protein [Fuerstiella marisgermanici]|uniref:Basal-body rod modification protein FlgD n=1 Tax=Fuerstiella marisgermanici TaxID=1891926 RepID=A0A1P8WM18_9PLAN|nr:flagellar hook capping FlgD N-terminal domain-containing protein [Fuerstiella marisgermanici]APZ95091.1 Basal-body rod modification protein FlgD [Fuerstiella marisgermanici]
MAEEFSAELGRSQFLQMFVAQVQHQDPLSPMDQTEILGQLAQFSQVESLETLNRNFDSFLQQELADDNSKLVSASEAVLGKEVELTTGGGGLVDAVRQEDGQVLVEIDGQLMPLADVSAISRVEPDSDFLFGPLLNGI